MTRATVEQALESLEEWTDEMLVGQLFSVASGDHTARDIMGFGNGANEEAQLRAHERLKQQIRDYHLGGIIYFPPGDKHEPVANIRQDMLDLQDVASVPLLIATDQENGTVARIQVGVEHLPGAMALAAADNPVLTKRVGYATGEQLRSGAIFQTYAPVADVNVVPSNPSINVRSPGSDPQTAARHVATEVQAFSDGGVASTLKHFPGYGSATVDPHHGLPLILLTREEWNATERLPFQEGIKAGADSVMLAHALFPALDPNNAATFSPAIVRDLLRNELGFDGVIVTDAMEMGGAARSEGPAEACVLALQAGVDQILMPADLPEAYEAVLAALKDGRLDRTELQESARRILELKLKLGLDSPSLPTSATVDSIDHAALAAEVAAASIALRDPSQKPFLAENSAVLLIHPGVDPQRRGANPGDIIAPILEQTGHHVKQIVWGNEGDLPIDLEEFALADTEVSRDAVIVLRDAWKSHLPVTDLLDSLFAAGVKANVIVTRSPFEASTVQRDCPVVFSYGDNAYALEAAARVVAGVEAPNGILPMPVTDLETSAKASNAAMENLY